MPDTHTDEFSATAREEAVQQFAVLSAEMVARADELVALLLEHKEERWADNFAYFSSEMKAADTDSAYEAALRLHRSFYGGMGSWNDFYLLALGEAEAKRGALTGELGSLSEQFIAALAAAPKSPVSSLWRRLLRRFS